MATVRPAISQPNHEKFGLVKGLINNILVEKLPLQIQGFLHESRTVKCAERHSQNSLGSSSLVVHFAEDVCRHHSQFSVMRYQTTKLPPETQQAHYFYVSVWMVGYSVGGSLGCDISFSASWSSDGFDVEHITCGTFPSLSEGCWVASSCVH